MTNWGAHVWDIVQWGLGMDESGPAQIIPPNGKDVPHLTYVYPNGVRVIRNKIAGISKDGLAAGFRASSGLRQRRQKEAVPLRVRNAGPDLAREIAGGVACRAASRRQGRGGRQGAARAMPYLDTAPGPRGSSP